MSQLRYAEDGLCFNSSGPIEKSILELDGVTTHINRMRWFSRQQELADSYWSGTKYPAKVTIREVCCVISCTKNRAVGMLLGSK